MKTVYSVSVWRSAEGPTVIITKQEVVERTASGVICKSGHHCTIRQDRDLFETEGAAKAAAAEQCRALLDKVVQSYEKQISTLLTAVSAAA